MQYPSLKERAYSIIRSRILNGEIEPGVRIREDLLAEEISMSRTPVREAINQLAAEGLVKNIPRKGIYSIDLSEEYILELLDVRESLEILSVKKCIERITDVQLAQLEKINQDFAKMLEMGKYDKCNELDSKFHATITRFSGNRKLIQYLSEIEDFMRIARVFEKKTMPEEKNKATLQEHKEILECIKNKDKDGAARAIVTNITTMKINMGISKGDAV
jgi:DNA-binding GntR family transcriptional regulator